MVFVGRCRFDSCGRASIYSNRLWRCDLERRPERLKLGGVLFLIAGAAFLGSAALGNRTAFFTIGIAFIVIGIGLIARARK